MLASDFLLSSFASSFTWLVAPARSGGSPSPALCGSACAAPTPGRAVPEGEGGRSPPPGRSLWFLWHRRLTVGGQGHLSAAGRRGLTPRWRGAPGRGARPREGAFLTRCPSTPRFRPFPAFVANSYGDASRRDPRPRCLFYYFPPFVQKTYTALSYLHSGSFKGIQHGARKTTSPSRALLLLVLEEKLSFAEFRLTFLRACASGERAGNSFLPEPADPEGSARGRGVCGPQDLERAVGRDKKAAR